MTLLTAGDGGLLAGLFIIAVFILMCLWMIIGFITYARRNKERSLRAKLLSLFFLALLCLGIRMAYSEYHLLNNFDWIEGRVIDRCNAQGALPSYEFEYYLDGKRYTNCHTSGTDQKVRCPNGRYMVRVSRKVPGMGRMDFEQEITTATSVK